MAVEVADKEGPEMAPRRQTRSAHRRRWEVGVGILLVAVAACRPVAANTCRFVQGSVPSLSVTALAEHAVAEPNRLARAPAWPSARKSLKSVTDVTSLFRYRCFGLHRVGISVTRVVGAAPAA